MSRIIEVTVSPQGEATVQTKGYFGSSLRDIATEVGVRESALRGRPRQQRVHETSHILLGEVRLRQRLAEIVHELAGSHDRPSHPAPPHQVIGHSGRDPGS